MSVILLVDDEPGMGELVEFWLADLGARVVQAGTIDEGVEAARQHSPRAVLLDLSLDDEDGLELIPRLREDDQLADLPVIAFTVHDSREQEARASGAAGFVPKPFRSGQLHDEVRRFLP